VLFTVRQFSQEAQEQLLPLVRCPHLSDMWIPFLIDQASAAPRSTSTRQLLPQLKKLMKLRSSAGFLSPSDMSKLMPGAPGSWLLGERAHSDVDSVFFPWDVSISSLQEAVRRSVRGGAGRTANVESPGQSAPLRGVPFKIKVACNKGKIGIYALPQLPPDFATCSAYQLEAGNRRRGGDLQSNQKLEGLCRLFRLGRSAWRLGRRSVAGLVQQAAADRKW